MPPVEQPMSEPESPEENPGAMRAITLGNEYRGKNASFLEYLKAPYGERADEYRQDNEDALGRFLPGLVDAECVPPDFFKLAPHFSADDWEYIRNGPDSLMRLVVVTNYYRSCAYATSSSELSLELIAELASLPIVYQTTPDRLRQIFASGEVLSDRAFAETLEREGHSADRSDERERFATNTYGEDRRIGLDGYVFATFGKPYTEKTYGSVSVLFKPDALQRDEGAFATEDDYLDLVDRGAENVYRRQILNGRYFYKAVTEFIQGDHSDVAGFLGNVTDRKNQFGGVAFSTWEVKVPRLSVADVDKIVFDDIEDLRAFQRAHGSDIPLVYKPNGTVLRDVVMRETGVPERVVRAYPDQQLRSWCGQFFREHPERMVEYFGDCQPVFEVREMYRVRDAEDRATRMGIQFVEEGREARALTVPRSEQGVFYQKINAESRFVTPFAKLERLVGPTPLFFEPRPPVRFSSLDAARAKMWEDAEAKVILVHPDEAVMIDVNTVRYRLVRVRAPLAEIAAGDVRHYEIDDIVELEEPPHFN